MLGETLGARLGVSDGSWLGDVLGMALGDWDGLALGDALGAKLILGIVLGKRVAWRGGAGKPGEGAG